MLCSTFRTRLYDWVHFSTYLYHAGSEEADEEEEEGEEEEEEEGGGEEEEEQEEEEEKEDETQNKHEDVEFIDTRIDRSSHNSVDIFDGKFG